MRLADMPEFKMTEIGRVPVDWTVEQVATLANVDSESLSNKTAAEFSFRYISLGDVDAGKLIGGHSPITFAEAPSRARRIVRSGDILFATVRPNLKGHFFARRIDGNVVASTGFAVIRAKEGIAAPAFIYQSLLSGNVDVQIEKLTVGSNYPAVNSTDVKGLLLPAPPLPEQQKIAAILTAVDDKLDVIARRIEATQTLKQGLMQTLFSRGIGTYSDNGRWVPHAEFKDSELGEIPVKWEVVPQGMVTTFFNGRAYKLTEWEEAGTPVIRLQNLTGSGDKYYYSNLVLPEHQYVHKGDLLYMWSATFGPYIWWGEKAIYHYHIWKVECGDRVDKRFMYYSLSWLTAAMKGKTHGSTMMHLTKAGMQKYPMVLPPIGEQRQIAAVLSGVDSKIELLRARQTHFQNLKRGLMQKLITGEWRVNVNASET